MEKFIKENWFKVIIILIVLLSGLVFLFYLQTQQKEAQQKQLLESSIKCNQDGLIFFDSYKMKMAAYGGMKFNDPIYHFNRLLNSCFISISYQDSTHYFPVKPGDPQNLWVPVYDIQHDEITDIYSNKTLISTENSKEDAHFQQQKQLLMNE